jgi:predicted deacylase
VHLPRAGAVEHRRDLGDQVGREAAAAGVLEHHIGVLGVVDAVDLVAGDVAVAPGVGRRSSATVSLDFVVVPRSSSSVSLLAPAISRSMM